jgi:hypothetical protein
MGGLIGALICSFSVWPRNLLGHTKIHRKFSQKTALFFNVFVRRVPEDGMNSGL